MNTLASLVTGAEDRCLEILGIVDLDGDQDAPAGMNRLVLLGPAPHNFWPEFSTSPENLDNNADPIDRWSKRVIGDWAQRINGHAIFPFGGPPYAPFLRWAAASGRAWSSPVGALVHDRFGLMVSYRGALALPERFDIPPRPEKPCDSCNDKPCLTACPVGALGANPYDVSTCKAHISTVAGEDCLSSGCLVRRACPISLGAGRDPAQSAYHMSLFLGPK